MSAAAREVLLKDLFAECREEFQCVEMRSLLLDDRVDGDVLECNGRRHRKRSPLRGRMRRMPNSLRGGAIEAGSVGEGKGTTTVADFSARHDTKTVFR